MEKSCPLGFELIERRRGLTIASEDESTDHLVMSPLTILRRLESDKLNTAPEAMDETVSTRDEERIDDEDEWLRNRNAAVSKVSISVTPDEAELRTAQVNQIRLIRVLARFFWPITAKRRC